MDLGFGSNLSAQLIFFSHFFFKYANILCNGLFDESSKIFVSKSFPYMFYE